MTATAITAAKKRSASLLAAWLIAPVLLVLAGLFVADQMYNPERFRIESVAVSGGLQRVDAKQVQAVAARAISGNYFSLSLPHIEAQVEAVPWVFSASVRRRWPATLLVEITEVQPVAAWGEAHWLHASGDLVARESVPSDDIKRRFRRPQFAAIIRCAIASF